MSEEKVVKMIEISTSQGELVCSFQIKEVMIQPAANNPKDHQKTEKGQGEKNEANKGGNSDNEEMMTYAQKRYLFRLLADRGTEGDLAHGYLKERFKVESLKEVTKAEASQEIERLLKEEKGGDAHAGSSK